MVDPTLTVSRPLVKTSSFIMSTDIPVAFYFICLSMKCTWVAGSKYNC